MYFSVALSQDQSNVLGLGQQQLMLAYQGNSDDFLKNYAVVQGFYCDQKGRNFVHKALAANKRSFLSICGKQKWWPLFLEWFAKQHEKKSVFRYACKHNPTIIRLLLELGFTVSQQDIQELIKNEVFIGFCALFAYGIHLPRCDDSVDAQLIDGWRAYQNTQDLTAFFKITDLETILFEQEDLRNNDGWITVHSYIWLFAASKLQDLRACMHIYNAMLEGEKDFLYQACVAQPLLKHICLHSPELLVWVAQNIWGNWEIKDCLSLVSAHDVAVVTRSFCMRNFFKKLQTMLSQKKFSDICIYCD